MSDRTSSLRISSQAFATKSRVYSDVNSELGPEWYGIQNDTVQFGDMGEYEIGRFLGSGKYSDVFLGSRNGKPVALKILKPTRELKLIREAKVLQNLQGIDNIVQIEDVLKNPQNQQITLVFEYIEYNDMISLIGKVSDLDSRICMYQLIKTIKYLHSNGIMHRDIKPHNVMFDPKTRQMKLIDFGMAEFYFPGQYYRTNVGSKNFKAPELLLGYPTYDYSVDIWGFGATLACLIFAKFPFFEGSSENQVLSSIIELQGSENLNDFVKAYNISTKYDQTYVAKKSLFETIQGTNRKTLPSREALDLIERCLIYDHQKRITAEEAMMHPFFDPVRKMV